MMASQRRMEERKKFTSGGAGGRLSLGVPCRTALKAQAGPHSEHATMRCVCVLSEEGGLDGGSKGYVMMLTRLFLQADIRH
jgi:hypothetical protein